jgi:hypothetical protein
MLWEARLRSALTDKFSGVGPGIRTSCASKDRADGRAESRCVRAEGSDDSAEEIMEGSCGSDVARYGGGVGDLVPGPGEGGDEGELKLVTLPSLECLVKVDRPKS